MQWAVGTMAGEVIKGQNEALRFAQAQARGAKCFYVPADLSVLKSDSVGFKQGRAN